MGSPVETSWLQGDQVNSLLVNFILLNYLLIRNKKSLLTDEICIWPRRFIFKNLNNNFIWILLSIEGQFILSSLESTACAHLTNFAIGLLKIYKPFVLFSFVRLVVFVKPYCLNEEDQQVDKPNKSNLKVDCKHQNGEA